MTRTVALLSSLCLFGLAGCPADDGGGTGDGGSTSSTPGTTTDGATSTTPPTTSDGSGSGGGTTTTTPATDSGGSTGNNMCPMAGELGDACTDPMCDCMSGNCFVVGPLGGVCSECDEDADCEATTGFGCNFGNPLEGTPAVCSTTGDIGESCETTDSCAEGLFCPTLIEVPGILSAATCSECEDDAGCNGQECAPTYDIAAIGGFYQCVDAGSIPNDEGCDLTGGGEECMSGNCAPAAIMGIPVVGVCSECNEDADCMGGGTCVLPEIAIKGTSLALVPGMCM